MGQGVGVTVSQAELLFGTREQLAMLQRTPAAHHREELLHRLPGVGLDVRRRSRYPVLCLVAHVPAPSTTALIAASKRARSPWNLMPASCSSVIGPTMTREERSTEPPSTASSVASVSMIVPGCRRERT